jgi:hypothetical protein
VTDPNLEFAFRAVCEEKTFQTATGFDVWGKDLVALRQA